jgi:hypothetical protein
VAVTEHPPRRLHPFAQQGTAPLGAEMPNQASMVQPPLEPAQFSVLHRGIIRTIR